MVSVKDTCPEDVKTDIAQSTPQMHIGNDGQISRRLEGRNFGSNQSKLH